MLSRDLEDDIREEIDNIHWLNYYNLWWKLIINNISICIRFNITKLKNWYTESIYNVEFEESECIIKYFEDENFYSDFDEKLIDYDNDEIVDDRL